MTPAPPGGSTPPGLGCAVCRAPLGWPTDTPASVTCTGCGLHYGFYGRFMRYAHKALLFERPGYLEFEDPQGFVLCGLDPMDDRHLFGWHVMGCAEMTPFTDAQFQRVVYATSLDHVCDLEHATRETVRIVAPGGRVVIWMGDQLSGLLRRLRRRAGEIFRGLQKGYRTDRFLVQKDLTVFFCTACVATLVIGQQAPSMALLLAKLALAGAFLLAARAAGVLSVSLLVAAVKGWRD
jgi:SAM-dependent methyltransferase